VLHDIHIDTVTDVARRFPGRARADGRFYALDFTLAELKQLAATERLDPRTGKAVFAARFPAGHSSFQVPTLEEELQLVQGLNRSTGREVGVYPEIKDPAWHRQQGQDISRIVVGLLRRYGYGTKSDKVYLQCFDFEEVKRLRGELGWQGRLVQLIADAPQPGSATDHARLRTRAGLAEVARVADGIGPSLGMVIAGRSGGILQVSDLVRDAHALGLEVHPYTFRADALPEWAGSFEELLRAFLVDAAVDGIFTDHPDKGVEFVRSLRSRP
jgi:glycerophosphoryl diester phosphodiesterase